MTYKEPENPGNTLANNYYRDKADIIRAKSNESDRTAIERRAENLLMFLSATVITLVLAPYAVLSALSLNGAMTPKAAAITALATFVAVLYMKPHMQRWYWWRVSWLQTVNKSYVPFRPWDRLRAKWATCHASRRQPPAPSRPGSPLEWLD